MKNVLMVAEKPSLAASLAHILSNGANSSRRGKQITLNLTYKNYRFLFQV